MATIGQPLLAPEQGWRRFDDKEVTVISTGAQLNNTDAGAYKGSSIVMNGPTGTSQTFKFRGTGIRLIGTRSVNWSRTVTVKVDGISYPVSQNGAITYQVLLFELLGLANILHEVEITSTDVTYPYYGIDAIDLIEGGVVLAQVGYSLPTPEAGWRRYNDTLTTKLTYTGGPWTARESTDPATVTAADGTDHYTNVVGSSVVLNFKGTKFRFIGCLWSNTATSVEVDIDGVKATISQRATAGNIQSCLNFEKLDLSDGDHVATVTLKGGGYLGVDAFDVDAALNPAVLGQSLPSPELGWKRIDDRDPHVLYSGPKWKWAANGVCWEGGAHTMGANPITDEKCIIAFEGTKFRLVSSIVSDYTADLTVKLDGVEYPSFSVNGTAGVLILLFEKTGLTPGKHTVEIYAKSDLRRWSVDSFDIDADGKMVHPYLAEKTSIKNMEVGDIISCEYVATSGAYGTFSKLGEATKPGIGRGASAAPDGSFHFVMVGHDHKGRKKLVADRPVQHTLAWDTVNALGLVAGGNFLPKYAGGELAADYEIATLMMSGGVSSADKANDWDKIIAEYDLGGKVTAGSDAIWNYNGLQEWTSTTHASGLANRVTRGTSLTAYNSAATTAVATVGYRPVLLVDTILGLLVTQDREASLTAPVTLTAEVRNGGAAGSYRLLVDSVVVQDWTPRTAEQEVITVPVTAMQAGVRTLNLEMDVEGTLLSKTIEVIKKAVDSVWWNGAVKQVGTKTLSIGPDKLAFIKLVDPSFIGYFRAKLLELSVQSGAGNVKVYKAAADWSEQSVQPPISATYVEGAPGSVDIQELGEASYGYAVTAGSDMQLNVNGAAVTIETEPTQLELPSTIYGNRVALQWKPVLTERPESFLKLKVMRSSNADMSGAVVVFETGDKDVLQCTDNTVTEGKAYYNIIVEQVDYPYAGGQIDFDVADEGMFIQQDATKTEFVGGSVQLTKTPAATVTHTFDSDAGLTYDAAKVVVTGGRIQLKEG